MTWQIKFDPRAYKELAKLDQPIQIRILKFIKQRLGNSNEPKSLGFPLKGNLAGLWKYRIGDYRLVCRIKHIKLHILIIKVGHRKDIYK